MAHLNNNNIREDPVFNKVKCALLTGDGPAAMVSALSLFEVESEKAKENGQPGLTHDEFLEYLEDCGVSLAYYEKRYLCSAFQFREKEKEEYISGEIFTRHLLGVNFRRMQAIKQAWDCLDKNEAGRVPRSALEDTQLRSTTGGNKEFCATLEKADFTRSTQSNSEDSTVSYNEFLAFYAAVSQSTPSDEAFVARVLRDWGADNSSAPKLSETERDWGEEGDPLRGDFPRTVKDAVHPQLGISTKTYDYHHMERVHPPVDPLPPLDREDVMTTMNKKLYVPPNEQEKTIADPLSTRRGQLE